MSTTTEIAAIREEVNVLADRLEAVEAHLGKNGFASSLPFDLATVLNDVQLISEELFPGRFEVTHEFDPEYPDDRYLVVNVEASGEVKEIVARTCRWHERIRQLSADLSGYLRLSVVPL